LSCSTNNTPPSVGVIPRIAVASKPRIAYAVVVAKYQPTPPKSVRVALPSAESRMMCTNPFAALSTMKSRKPPAGIKCESAPALALPPVAPTEKNASVLELRRYQ
jgi:hypothetical protein